MARALLVTLLLAGSATASIQLGPVSTAVASVGACPDPHWPCLAVAGDGARQLLVWPEIDAGKTRLRATSGSTPFDLFAAGWIDQPSVAFDGQSYLVVWRHSHDYGFAVSAMTVSATAQVPRLIEQRRDRDPHVRAKALWTGVEFAVATPSELFSFRHGLPSIAVFGTISAASPVAVLAAVNGTSTLVVREIYYFPHCGMTPAFCTPGGFVVTSNVIDSRAEARQTVLSRGEDRQAMSLAAGGDGYLLVWKGGGAVQALRLDQTGLPVGFSNVVATSRVSDGVSAVAATRDGWLVIWEDVSDGETIIQAAELDANGTRIGKPMTLAVESFSPAILETGPDRFRLFYRSATGIESRVITTGSEPLTSRRRSVR